MTGHRSGFTLRCAWGWGSASLPPVLQSGGAGVGVQELELGVDGLAALNPSSWLGCWRLFADPVPLPSWLASHKLPVQVPGARGCGRQTGGHYGILVLATVPRGMWNVLGPPPTPILISYLICRPCSRGWSPLPADRACLTLTDP